MCDVIRAPFLPSGSFETWTRISWPSRSSSEIVGLVLGAGPLGRCSSAFAGGGPPRPRRGAAVRRTVSEFMIAGTIRDARACIGGCGGIFFGSGISRCGWLFCDSAKWCVLIFSFRLRCRFRRCLRPRVRVRTARKSSRAIHRVTPRCCCCSCARPAAVRMICSRKTESLAFCPRDGPGLGLDPGRGHDGLGPLEDGGQNRQEPTVRRVPDYRRSRLAAGHLLLMSLPEEVGFLKQPAARVSPRVRRWVQG